MNSPADSLRSTQLTDTSPFTAGLRFLRQRLIGALVPLRGRIELCDALGSISLGTSDSSNDQPLSARITVTDPEFYRRVALNGSVGAGEAYMDGMWHCDDLLTLIRLLVRNRDLLDAMETGPARIGGALMKAWHALRRNTRLGSRRNIAAHYDLGNDLFALFLDDSMMYSSALFASPDESLEQAQFRKLERICRKLDLRPGQHIVEIGTGWGGFAIHAARHHDVRVTTTTISREQHALASQQVAEAGLSDRITLLLEDYRALEGKYDRLVSIEMIEAVGHHFLETYLATCARLLNDDGLALIQAITIEDQRYAKALKEVDFIKRHIFPGSFIPSVSAIVSGAARASDLRLVNLEDIGPSYALTLRHWRSRFFDRIDAVKALGYDARFVRMWEFYLCYCEGGFLERSISDVHLLFARPGNRRTEFLPGEPACA
jgi:cyclopropane-fatty-acyl-phospholipid synthase